MKRIINLLIFAILLLAVSAVPYNAGYFHGKAVGEAMDYSSSFQYANNLEIENKRLRDALSLKEIENPLKTISGLIPLKLNKLESHDIEGEGAYETEEGIYYITMDDGSIAYTTASTMEPKKIEQKARIEFRRALRLFETSRNVEIIDSGMIFSDGGAPLAWVHFRGEGDTYRESELIRVSR